MGAGIVDLPPRDGIGALSKYQAWSQQIYAAVTGEGYSYTKAPPRGVHILKIVRESQAFRLFADGKLVLSPENVRHYPLRFAELIFGGSGISSFKGLHVNYI